LIHFYKRQILASIKTISDEKLSIDITECSLKHF